jgi:hypothetical protein
MFFLFFFFSFLSRRDQVLLPQTLQSFKSLHLQALKPPILHLKAPNTSKYTLGTPYSGRVRSVMESEAFSPRNICYKPLWHADTWRASRWSISNSWSFHCVAFKSIDLSFYLKLNLRVGIGYVPPHFVSHRRLKTAGGLMQVRLSCLLASGEGTS